MRTISTVLALVLFGPASGADPVPTFTVENKLPPTFTVVNKTAPIEKPQMVPGVAPRPGEPVKVTPGVVIQRPFSEVMQATPAPASAGTAPLTSGAVTWSQSSLGVVAAPIRTLVPYAVQRGGIRCASG
jgi:hypothetical protein